MQPTCFIYSSHNCCEYIHRWWIVERALQSADNKTILYLPFSEGGNGGEFGSPQQFGWGKFEWYLNQYKNWGLHSYPFYWNDSMNEQQAHELLHLLSNSEVVILGGGNSSTGLSRYKVVGEHFFGDRDLFRKVLQDRAQRGKLTVGFSAGADQLGSILTSQIFMDLNDSEGFGLAHNIMTTLHHESSRNEELYVGSQKFPHMMIFGLPNDSGLGVSQGVLPSGNIWQVIDFVTDKSWDIPQDEFHIKTRHGQGIEHVYGDGRHWSFQGGEKMARVMAPDSSWQDAYIFLADGSCYSYWTQEHAPFGEPSQVFANF